MPPNERVQQRLKQNAYAPTRVDLNADFPLRGAIACAECGKPLTACWSRGRSGDRHPYYLCFGKGCERYVKSIRRDRIEGEFTTLLRSLIPTPNLLTAAKRMFRQAWDHRLSQAAAMAKARERELAALDKQIATLLDRIVAATTGTVIGAYESRIAELERQKIALMEKQVESAKPRGTFD